MRKFILFMHFQNQGKSSPKVLVLINIVSLIVSPVFTLVSSASKRTTTEVIRIKNTEVFQKGVIKFMCSCQGCKYFVFYSKYNYNNN